MSDIKKVVLAYSGGLDTSVILKWLQVTYNCEVVTFTAGLGQEGELEPARAKAVMIGVKPEHIYIDDLREQGNRVNVKYGSFGVIPSCVDWNPSSPPPRGGGLGGGAPTPAWTRGFCLAPHPRPLPAGVGR